MDARAETDEIVPARKIKGRVVALFATTDPKHFETAAVERLALGLDGIAGDRHGGFERRSSGREPWYPRGTPIRNGRHLSILSVEDLAEIARRLEVPAVDAASIGANLVVEGIPRLSMLPRGTRLSIGPAAALNVDDQNAPCRIAGRSLAKHLDRPDIELGFAKVAQRLRGVVASVDRAGEIAIGDEIVAHLPEQWIYRP
jgi:hypothetical protein